MNQSHYVMWFHDRDGFTKPYKTRKDAAIAGRGYYDC
jgi:hypothetical protein